MRILIVDDEANARERLRRLIEGLEADYDVVGEASDGEMALGICATQRVDAVLLDIEMPGIGGLETAERLAALEPPPAVLLVTAYPEHALEAFERCVDDYLLKPVRAERLRSALGRLQVLTRPQQEALSRTVSGRSERKRLSAYYRGGIQSAPLEDILYLQAEQKYVTVHHTGGSLLVDESLKSLEEEFPERFMRVHRNALVARERIEGLERGSDGGYLLRLRGSDVRLPVSRRHLTEVKRWLRP